MNGFASPTVGSELLRVKLLSTGTVHHADRMLHGLPHLVCGSGTATMRWTGTTAPTTCGSCLVWLLFRKTRQVPIGLGWPYQRATGLSVR